MERKSEKIPTTALSLYIKLYCKKKGSTATKYHSNLIEATKSWVSLCDSEKQQFYDKLNECKTQYRKQFAEYLKHAKPYLKRKQCKSIPSNQGVEHQDILNVDETKCDQNNTTLETDASQVLNESITKAEIGFIKSNWEEQIEECQNEEMKNQDIPQIDRQTEEHTQNEDSMENTHELPTLEVLPEPTPPNVKTAEELFKIVQAMEGQYDRTWKSLTKPEKSRYQNALLKLKNTYIMKYKEYLEKLPPKELFDHYNKQIFN